MYIGDKGRCLGYWKGKEKKKDVGEREKDVERGRNVRELGSRMGTQGYRMS